MTLACKRSIVCAINGDKTFFTACLTSDILCFRFPCNERFSEVSSTKLLRAFNFRHFIGVFIKEDPTCL